jgi:hypothetical protein
MIFKFSILAVGLLLVSSATAFWRLPCAKPVLDARIDPIVTSGRASSHAHTVMGSNGALIYVQQRQKKVETDRYC